MSQVHIRCSECGKFNKNTELCEYCGAVLCVIKKRTLERQHIEQKRLKEELEKEPSKIDKIFIKMSRHPNVLIRLIFTILNAIWIGVMAIAMFIAWLMSLIVA
ncbi:hypothetical protein [Myroides injenensis]|uniref:hypothetical protein n=1 Tax=Myroides injenensis TaxID=1183151 RepID=UPI0002888945|nr:hypothetical protein [Myroides injenensis]